MSGHLPAGEAGSHDVRTYFLIFTALIVMTAVTVAVAFLDLGPLNTVVAVTIASIKAALVLVYFMHLDRAGGLVRVYATAGFFWIILLAASVLTDIVTRPL